RSKRDWSSDVCSSDLSYGRMLKKDILYTAITRASKSLSLIGEPEAFIRSIQSTQNLRNTALKERLQSDKYKFDSLEKNTDLKDTETEKNPEENMEKIKSYILTPKMVEHFSIDPMIGMENIKP